MRRVMAQEGLAARSSGKAGRYSSYAGGCSPAPENLLRRDFHAREPGQRWLADITKTKAADGRICLSPVLDCFDGRIVAYSAGRRADAELANSSLSRAIATLGADARPIVHSDRGGHYRRPEWISIMQERKLARSMSAKGCGPHSSAMEGFFGRMKTEATYPEHWERLTCEQAIARTGQCIAWRNAERIRQGLGYQSPDQHRRSHGLMA